MYFKSSSEKASKVYYLGEYSSGAEVDVASKFAGYASLTNANFIVEPTSTLSGSFGYSINGYSNVANGAAVSVTVSASSETVTKSYNNSTGKLTVTIKSNVSSSGRRYNVVDWSSESWTTGSGNGSFTGKVKVYLIDGTIETL